MNKISILKDVFGSYFKTNDEYLFYCPFCKHHKRKLSVNIEKNVWKCWICDKSGRSLYPLLKRFGSRDQKNKWKELSNEINLSDDIIFEAKTQKEDIIKVELPKTFISLTENSISLNPARNFLTNRGVETKHQHFYKCGVDLSPTSEYYERVIIPSFNKEGYINFFIARTYRDGFPKYKGPAIQKSSIIFNELYIDWSKPIVLTEGVFDAIIAGENAVPLLGSTLQEEHLLFERITKENTVVYIALDSDAQKKEMKIADKLMTYGVEVWKINISPHKDVGEMTREEFLKRKKEAIYLNNENNRMRLAFG